MPNWCSNKIIITGEKDKLTDLIEFVESKELNYEILFDKIIPVPTDISETMEGYYFRLNNWGTKWEPDSIGLELTGNDVIFTFETAWSPSIGITAKLAELYPELKIIHIYEEMNTDYSGRMEWENGKVTLNIDGEYGDYQVWDPEYYEGEEEGGEEEQ